MISVENSSFFISPGSQKAGSTSLHDILRFHPQICLPEEKESKYFLNNDQVSLEDYCSKLFPADSKATVYGEVDPDYMYDREVPEKLLRVFGKQLKLVFLLRNPVDRAYSHYWMSVRRGFETKSFEEAFEGEAERLTEKTRHVLWHYSYFERGFYSKYIANFIELFDSSNIRFVLFDDFIARRSIVLAELLNFLGLDQDFVFPNQDARSNEGSMPRSRLLARLHGQPMMIKSVLKKLIPIKALRWKLYPLVEKLNASKDRPPKMSDEFRKYLVDYYREEVQVLEAMLGRDLSFWRQQPEK